MGRIGVGIWPGPLGVPSSGWPCDAGSSRRPRVVALLNLTFNVALSRRLAQAVGDVSQVTQVRRLLPRDNFSFQILALPAAHAIVKLAKCLTDGPSKRRTTAPAGSNKVLSAMKPSEPRLT